MKISKTAWICLIIGVFILAGVSLGMTRIQQTQQQQELQNKLAKANFQLSQIKLDELIEKEKTLTSQIDNYEAQTAECLSILAYSGDSIDTTAEILTEAQKRGVDIQEINSSGISTEELDGNKCETLQLSLKVNGSTGNISGFVCGLGEAFPTSVIKSVQLDMEPSPGETGAGSSDAEAASSNNTTMRINLVIYNFKGKM